VSLESLVILVGPVGFDVERVVAAAHDVSVLLCPTVSDALDLLGRGRGDDIDPVVEAGNLRIDQGAFEASVAGAPLQLTALEFSVLAELARKPNRVRSFTWLLDRAWSPSVALEGDASLVHSTVKRLRRKLQAAGADVRIESVRGVGLRLLVGRPFLAHVSN
jgi:DNA-binding response OmpR family regulator